jgi:hypothetical protein
MMAEDHFIKIRFPIKKNLLPKFEAASIFYILSPRFNISFESLFDMRAFVKKT